MDRFTELIRRYSPQEIMKKLYIFSISMMENENKGFLEIPVYVQQRRQGTKRIKVVVPVWEISEIVYWSIVKSNDYRDKQLDDAETMNIINEFRGFQNENHDKSFLKNAKFSDISKFLFGMMGEQEQFQNLRWLIDGFNRSYHILIARNNADIDCARILENEVGMNIDEFCKILILLSGVCEMTQTPMEINYREIEALGIEYENFCSIIHYYSADYGEIRKSPLKEQIFYTKPFIISQKPKRTYAVAYHYVGLLLANGLYWCIRNYFFKKKSQKFLNAFGNMFEEYLDEISGIFLDPKEYKHLIHKDDKIADFRYEFDDIVVLVEQKSALIRLDVKSQMPNMDNAKQFLNRNIAEAYEQLEATCKRETTEKPILKFILLYENIQNVQLIQKSMPEIFEADPLCYVIGIAEFEQILRMRKEKYGLWRKVIEQLICKRQEKTTVTNILHNLEEFDYISIFTNEKDYHQKYVDELEESCKTRDSQKKE